MPDLHYVIVGGGMAAAAAIRGIRDVDRDGSIALIGTEPDPPYKRPPLSKDLWNGKSIDRIWSAFDRDRVTLHSGRTVQQIDLDAKTVTDDQGDSYPYDRLLATGTTPRRLPFDDEGLINYYRTANDYRRLRDLAGHSQRFAVIGGGFIGSEIAAALASNGKDVTLLFPGDTIGSRMFPKDLAHSLNEVYRAQGVDVRTGEEAIGLKRLGDGCVLRTRRMQDGTEHEIACDGVVAGIGVRPAIGLAESSGLHVEDGIIVDEFLRTSAPDVYAAGDVANVWTPALGVHRRVEHEDNANTMGRLAGRAMAGQPEPYDHLPFFYSDLFDLGYEAVGILDSRLQTVADWSEPFRKGTVSYLDNGKIRGVLLWNVWDRVDAAREVIRRSEAGETGLLERGLLTS